ncbi:hypothetical protein NPIL_422421 [Nephila pilipes]|uniref:Uncharacterized protein n=1 Tax=Nephila pilipes TaxID=299642 RepID=A0A8X6QC14_NEPPI|nr:hypothetical protein NPIL_422421 [Nephila pilipes]
MLAARLDGKGAAEVQGVAALQRPAKCGFCAVCSMLQKQCAKVSPSAEGSGIKTPLKTPAASSHQIYYATYGHTILWS